MYRPPSGAVPANSASMNEIGGDAPRVLIHFIRVWLGLTAASAPAAPLVDGHEHDFGFGHLDHARRARSCPLSEAELPQRSASTETRTVTDVRPTRTVSV